MTTTVVYSDATYDTSYLQSGNLPVALTAAQLYANDPTDAVTVIQTANNSGSTNNPSATFGSTPTNGNLLVAVLCETQNIAVSAFSGSGWTLAKAQGTTGRRVEIWYKVAGAAEPTTVTATALTTTAWKFSLIEFSQTMGNLVQVTANNGAAASGVGPFSGLAHYGSAVWVGGIALNAGGATCTISSWNFDNAAGARFDSSTSDSAAVWWRGFNNNAASTANGPQFAFGASKASSWAFVGFYGTGYWRDSSISSSASVGITGNGTSWSTFGAAHLAFDTSAIPDTATVSSVTMNLYGSSGSNNPNGADLEVWTPKLSGAGNVFSDTDTTMWAEPADFSGMTKLASFPAASTWANAYNALTSTGSFPAAINLTGYTYLYLATDDLRLGTLPSTTSTDDAYSFFIARQAGTANDPYLSIVWTAPQTQAVSGLDLALDFGAPTIRSNYPLPVSGLDLALDFGTPTLAPGGVGVNVGGLDLAFDFGTPTFAFSGGGSGGPPTKFVKIQLPDEAPQGVPLRVIAYLEGAGASTILPDSAPVIHVATTDDSGTRTIDVNNASMTRIGSTNFYCYDWTPSGDHDFVVTVKAISTDAYVAFENVSIRAKFDPVGLAVDGVLVSRF